MAARIVGPRRWSSRGTADGHRSYQLLVRVEVDSPLDGPAVAMSAPGLPQIGDWWFFDNDLDLWAFCTWEFETVPVLSGEPNKQFDMTFNFSTKPDFRGAGEPGGGGGGGGPPGSGGGGGAQNPLMEPMKVSGSYVRWQEWGQYDRHGSPIVNSAFEKITGPPNEWDASRPTVRISQNVPNLEVGLWHPMVDTLNSSPLWGLPARCWKLSTVSWERKWYGFSNYYYTRTFDFEGWTVGVDVDTGELISGWDRDIADEGSKVLPGRWLEANGGLEYELIPIGYNGSQSNPIWPDAGDPSHFVRAQDRFDNYIRLQLNRGLPAGVNIAGTGTHAGQGASEQGTIHVEYYSEKNFLLLGIPVIL